MATSFNEKKVEDAFRRILNPLKQAFFLWAKLPAAAFMGVRLVTVNFEKAEVRLPYRWQSKNPFKSIYFVAQCAAAEFSTGILAATLLEGFDVKISMLVQEIQAKFLKKANTTVTFTCTQGAEFKAAILKAVETGEGVTLIAISKGVDATGSIVSEVQFTWSFKVKKR